MTHPAQFKANPWIGLVATALSSILPSVVRACPMCFSGGDQNGGAFLYGSLFMMIVPTVAIGSLVYWVYRRVKAMESGEMVPTSMDDDAPASPDIDALRAGEAVVLRMVERQQ